MSNDGQIPAAQVIGLKTPGSGAVDAGAVDYDGGTVAEALDTLAAATGRWEVWLDDSTPPAPLLTPDGTDWIYVKVD